MSSIHNLPGIILFIHVYVYVEALCAQTREENFAFKSLSYMDFLIAYSPMRSLKVCGASTQALRVKNQLIRVIFHFFNIITQWGTSPFIDKLIICCSFCVFAISGTVGEDDSQLEVSKSDHNGASNCYIISVGP